MAARSDAPASGHKNPGVLRVVGLIALALVALAIGAVRMGFVHLPGSQTDESLLAKGSRESTPTTTPAHAGDLDPDAPAQSPLAQTTQSRTAPTRPLARTASSSGSGAAVVTAVTADAPSSRAQLAHLDEHVTYQYNALGRRDPFQSLINGEFVGADVGGDAPPDPGGMKIVGIVWGASDQFAMVEDVRGNSYVLRKGDKVQNGYVDSLRRDAVVVNVTADGQSQQVVIPFARKGDANVR